MNQEIKEKYIMLMWSKERHISTYLKKISISQNTSFRIKYDAFHTISTFIILMFGLMWNETQTTLGH